MVKSLKEMIAEQIDLCRMAISYGDLQGFVNRVIALEGLLEGYIDKKDKTYAELVDKISNLRRAKTMQKSRALLSQYQKLFQHLMRVCKENELLIIDVQKDLLKKFKG